MKLMLVAVGHRMPSWVDAGFDDYARRMPRESPLKLVQVKPEPRPDTGLSAAAVERLTRAEAQRISTAIPDKWFRIALDERGKQWQTRELSSSLAAWQMQGRDVAFIIGGADGLHDSIRREANFVWALSSLTLPHGLVRVLVTEQLYRAQSILRNHPYHRE